MAEAHVATFVDTNIFLRHLLDDVPAQSAAARRLVHEIEQQTVLAWTSSLAIAEMVFVLENPKTYAFPRARLRDVLLPLLSLPNLRIEHKHLYPRVFDLYVALPIDFIDAYHAALISTLRQDSLYSFDTDFDRVPGLSRLEP